MKSISIKYTLMRCMLIVFAALLMEATVAISFALVPQAQADDGGISAKEYQIKAAYLYNFVKFVTWPGNQALDKTHVANICIVGENEFGSALALFKQASTPQLMLNVKSDVTDQEIPTCHILFISRSEEGRVGALLNEARNYPILTVSEISGFADKGGIIEMVKTEKSIGVFSKDKINLRVNTKTAEAEGLRIDAQLLEIAAEVLK